MHTCMHARTHMHTVAQLAAVWWEKGKFRLQTATSHSQPSNHEFRSVAALSSDAHINWSDVQGLPLFFIQKSLE